MIKIEKADRLNFTPESLDDFDRFQIVNDMYRLIDGGLVRKNHPFTETWSTERRREQALEILSGEYIAFCAFDDGKVVGELLLVPKLNEGRMIVDSLHVSRECRRKGIGRELMEAAKNEAKEHGAKALYMSCCSAVETIDYYIAMGCKISTNPIKSYAEEEPYDIQMELEL
ncbi:MAG: GNAT family N-acetyltransferase [Clostridia bacterium]|nr:GNAT family N-acetyltransferase [Clostridia bacterium]